MKSASAVVERQRRLRRYHRMTPLTLYRDWILQTARQWSFAL